MQYWRKRSGFATFFIVLAGQFVSTIGSAITSFGVSIWLFQQTEQATSITWANGAFLAPLLLLAPFAGTVVDRGNRKRIMLLTDSVAGVTTVVMLLLLRADLLDAWHIYLLNFFNGAVGAFQWPAFSASVTLMVKKEQYSRAAGLMQLANPTSRVVAPAIAATLLALANFELLLWVDLATFAFAVATLWLVRIPQPPVSAETSKDVPFLTATKRGFTYIIERPSLLKFQLLTMGTNFGTIVGVAVIVPMILATTGNDEAALATARSVAAAGGIVGGLLVGAAGDFKHKMRVVIVMMGLIGVTGVFYGVANTVLGWAAAGFCSQICSAFLSGNARALWQRKVPPDLQGRVFAIQGLLASVMFPVVTFAAGPLADNLFEPAMQRGGALANTFGWLVGTSAGSGMSLMTVLGSLFTIAVAAVGLFSSQVRNVETLVPDFDVAVISAE